MAMIDDGGPVYPVVRHQAFGGPEFYPSLSIRDYFAGQALAGLLGWSPAECDDQYKAETAASIAYRMADAMIAIRKKGGGE